MRMLRNVLYRREDVVSHKIGTHIFIAQDKGYIQFNQNVEGDYLIKKKQPR